MEGFEQIIDPETNELISTNTAHGKHIIKNYLNAIKFGADSDKIISTQMFYKKEEPKVEKVIEEVKEEKLETTKKNTTEDTVKELGSVRGICPICGENVYSTQERVKSAGQYYHEHCYTEMQKK